MGPCRSSRGSGGGRGVNQQCHTTSDAELNPTNLDVMYEYENVWYLYSMIYECTSYVSIHWFVCFPLARLSLDDIPDRRAYPHVDTYHCVHRSNKTGPEALANIAPILRTGRVEDSSELLVVESVRPPQTWGRDKRKKPRIVRNPKNCGHRGHRTKLLPEMWQKQILSLWSWTPSSEPCGFIVVETPSHFKKNDQRLRFFNAFPIFSRP